MTNSRRKLINKYKNTAPDSIKLSGAFAFS